MGDNFLISFRDHDPLHPLDPGKPGTGIGATTYIVTDPLATTYNLIRNGMSWAQWISLLRANAKKLVVFVHGFGDDADKVLSRHNSIRRNLPLDEEFTLVSFDWPAGNNPDRPIDGYTADKKNATTIAPKLLDFLQILQLNGFTNTNIHLLAHSMGAYVTETAFQVKNSVTVYHVVMAAADVDRNNYKVGSAFLTTFLSHCVDLTVYWSTEDKALWDSIKVIKNPYIPLGLRGYPEGDLPTKDKRRSLQCTDYFNVRVKDGPIPPGEELAWSHVWYLIFEAPPPQVSAFYDDMIEVLQNKPTVSTRVERNLLKGRGDLTPASESS
jgi:pimeloyl-ACP methyl ester carboxylesterase